MDNTGKRNFDVKGFLVDNITYVVLVILIVASSILSPSFLTGMNIRNIALQQTAPILVAMGMLLAILIGTNDLSVGAVMALGSSLCSILMTKQGMHFLPAMVITLVVGVIFGMFTGSLVAYGHFQGFVASLATMTIARGAAFVLTNGTPIKLDDGTLNTLVKPENGFPIIWITVAIVAVLALIMQFTAWGRTIIAIGSNETAVQLAGIRTKKYIVSVYAVSGCLAVLAGIFIAARASTGSATIGVGQELDAIAACVIGGASLSGGKGKVLNTVSGALVLALIANIMNLMAVPSYPQDIIKGFIIIGAVLLQTMTTKKEKTV